VASQRTADDRAAPTLQQVARVADVSIATASRVVTGSVPVSPEKRARVEQAIALLGYVPDDRARDLRRNHSSTIGYLIPNLAAPLYGHVFRRLHRDLGARGFTLLAFESDGDRTAEKSAVEVLVRSHARAVVVASPAGLAPAQMQLLHRRNIRVVFIDDRPVDATASSVTIDDRGGARTLAEHLIGLGHRRVGLIAGVLDGSSGLDRHAGYVDALRAAGLELDPRLVSGYGWSIDAGRSAVEELMALAEPPTAILACDPLLAAGAVVSLRDRGLAIPDDVSLASFFDSDHIHFLEPAITCLAGIETALVDGIVEVLDAPDDTARHVVRTLEMQLGGSTAAPRPATV
jgi:DNA-binding LacI/PurR family transcriptional regulator